MSEEIFSQGGLSVTRFTGPASSPVRDRRRYQFTVADGSRAVYTVLTVEQLGSLYLAIKKEGIV